MALVRISGFCLLAALLLPTASVALDPPGHLEIHFINPTTNAAAALVVGPDGTTVLMDDGKAGDVIPRYLADRVGMDPADDHLTYTIAGHLDKDHIQGFKDVLYNTETAGGYYDVPASGGNFYNHTVSESDVAGVAYDYLQAYLDAVAHTTCGGLTGGPVVPTVGDTILLGDGATLRFVAVDGRIVGREPVSVSDENERSIAVLIEYGDFQFLWASDLTGGDDPDCTDRSGVSSVDMESPLAEAISSDGVYPLLPEEGVDVLQVNHHGSKSSTNAYWMKRLKPEVAVISVGPNGYGHPTEVVVDGVLRVGAGCALLEGIPPALVLQTEEGDPPTASTTGYVVGDIRLTTDGYGYDIEATGPVRDGSPDERSAAGLPLTVLVDDLSPGCPMEQTLPSGVVTTAETWQAKHRLRSEGSFTVGAGGDVTLQAGTRVELASGFSVGDGGSLRVVIAPVTTCP
jgi:hypothetical protein